MDQLLQLTVVGLVVGCVYALTATGLVVTYTTSGIFNFAHGAVGMLGAFTYWQLTVKWGWPVLLALPVVLLVLAPLFGAAIERIVMRPLHGASVDVTLVITLGLLLFFLGVANYLWDQGQSRVLPELLASWKPVDIGGVIVTWGQIIIVLAAIGVAIGLRFLFSTTRIGIAMRGVVDDPDLCAMSGASPARIQQLSWAIGSGLAALAGILVAPKVGMSALQLTLLVINGYAAALFGRLKSLPRTAVGGLALGLLVSYYPVYFAPHLPFSTTFGELEKAVPMIFLGVLLLFLPSARLRTATTVGRIAPTVPGLRQSLGGGALMLVVGIVLASSLSSANLLIAGGMFISALALLSLVLLTGYSGQTSLCVLTFFGLGAFAMAHSGTSPLGLLWGGLLAAGAGMLVALVTARLRGLYLALATFAFAKGMDVGFFNFHLGTGGSLQLKRFELPLVDTHSEKTFFLLTVIVFTAAAIGVLAVRRGRWGRQLTALNDSPAACATLGVNTTITKVVVFTAAAGIAGVAGALFGAQQEIITPSQFDVLGSLALLLALRIGGINTITGAIFGAFTIGLFPEMPQILGHFHVTLPDKVQLTFLLTGISAVVIGRDPDGLGGQMSKLGLKIRSQLGRHSTPPATPSYEEASLVHG